MVDIAHDGLAQQLAEAIAAVEVHVVNVVVQGVEQEAHQPRHVHLAALLQQEALQVIVGEAGVFHVDLAHDAHLYLLLGGVGHPVEVPGDLADIALEVQRPGPGVPLKLVRQLFRPVIHQPRAGARVVLVGLDLVLQAHQHVGVEYGHHGLQKQGGGELEAAVLLKPRGV